MDGQYGQKFSSWPQIYWQLDSEKQAHVSDNLMKIWKKTPFYIETFTATILTDLNKPLFNIHYILHIK